MLQPAALLQLQLRCCVVGATRAIVDDVLRRHVRSVEQLQRVGPTAGIYAVGGEEVVQAAVRVDGGEAVVPAVHAPADAVQVRKAGDAGEAGIVCARRDGPW